MVDSVERLCKLTGLPRYPMIAHLGIVRTKYFDWVKRQGTPTRHNAAVPRDFWITPEEKEAILAYHAAHPLDGYRRLSMMMLDASVASVSPATVYRILRQANVIDKHPESTSTRGRGFVQPQNPHAHWHVDVTYINICGTFYYLCSVLDGFSRAIVHHSLREKMTSADVEAIIQKACERHPESRPRIISDNGPQFVAKDFKTFIRLTGMTHVRTSPYYPQSNGKIEAWHKNMKNRTIRNISPRDFPHACEMVAAFVVNYNENRLHSALGYITPYAMLRGEGPAIFARRRQKLIAARAHRTIAAAIKRTQNSPPPANATSAA